MRLSSLFPASDPVKERADATDAQRAHFGAWMASP